MNDPQPSLIDRLAEWVWARRLTDLPPLESRLVWTARLLYALYRDLTQGYLSLQATSLVYTTLLSLVPLLAVSFSVLKGFGAHNALEPLLVQALEPLGDQGPAIAQRILEFVDNLKVGVLGSVGLAVLVYTVISMLQKIEMVFNYTWRVEETRPLAQRISQYLSVVLVGPVFLFTAIGLSASMRGSAFVTSLLALEPLGPLIDGGSALVRVLILVLAFAFLYLFVPNARVRLGSALIGALVAALLWQGVGWVFAHFMAQSTQYAAVYSSLAILILFMIWVDMAWLIVLVGASVTFYHQHPDYLSSRARDLKLSNRLRERLALVAVGHCARNYLLGLAPWTGDGLAEALGLPRANALRILGLLEQEGYLVRTADEPPRYLPAQAPEAVSLGSLLERVRCFEETQSGCRDTAPDPGIRELEGRVERGLAEALGTLTLRDLALSLTAPAGPGARPPRGADPADPRMTEGPPSVGPSER